MNLPVVLSDSLAELIRLSSCCDSSAERDEWRPDAAWAAPAGPPGPDCGCDPPCGWPMAASMASSSSLLLSSPLVSWCAASSDFRCIPATSPEANESFKCRLNRRESELRFTCLIPRIFLFRVTLQTRLNANRHFDRFHLDFFFFEIFYKSMIRKIKKYLKILFN